MEWIPKNIKNNTIHKVWAEPEKHKWHFRRLCFCAAPSGSENWNGNTFASGPAKRVRMGRSGVEGFLTSAGAWAYGGNK